MSDALRQAAKAFDELRREPVALALLAACGATECHLVGGALRDRALGLVSHDLDAIVAGRGGEIAGALAAALPARLVALGGKEFAAWRLIVAPGQAGGAGGLEASGGTAASERLVLDLWDRESVDLHDDLARRDFTVNSFAVELRGGAVADPFGGLGDLEQRTLRATTRESFAGDPLRVMRLARLLLRLPGFSAEPKTFELARSAAHRLPEAAAERIRDELWLLLSHPAAERGLRTLAALGLYPGLWLGTPGHAASGPAAADHAAAGDADDDDAAERAAADRVALDHAAAERAAADIAALPECAAELGRLLAPGAAPGSYAERPASPTGLPAAGRLPVVDLPSARFAATFRHLPAAAASPIADTAAGAGASGGHGLGFTPVLARLQQSGYLSARQAAAIAPLLEEPAVLPATELVRRRFLHRHGRLWLTVACSFGGAAAAAGGPALDRWRQAAGPLGELALREGPDLIAPPRLLGGDDVQRLLGIGPGPEVGSALAALTAAQVDGTVRHRDEAERFLREWSAAHAG